MFKVIIAGGRDFCDIEELTKTSDKLLTNIRKDRVEVVSGGARGADGMGEVYANMRCYYLKVMKANWEEHGKSAGHIRNREMGDYADVLIAFWDGESRGTKGMIDYMNKLGKPVRVIRY